MREQPPHPAARAQIRPDDRGSAKDDGVDRGLLFICLNTDITRQFEFVQQTWMLNPNFATLYDEADPLLGPKGMMTIPEEPLRRIIEVDTFVQMAGGEYFFLPSMPALRYLAGYERAHFPRRAAARAEGAQGLMQRMVFAADALFLHLPAPLEAGDEAGQQLCSPRATTMCARCSPPIRRSAWSTSRKLDVIMGGQPFFLGMADTEQYRHDTDAMRKVVRRTTCRCWRAGRGAWPRRSSRGRRQGSTWSTRWCGA
jgi:hypothetical protein